MRKLEAFNASPLLVNRFLLPLTLPAMFLARFGFVILRLIFLQPDLLLMWLLSFPLYLIGVLAWLGSYAAEVCRKDAKKLAR